MTRDELSGLFWAVITTLLITWIFIPWRFGAMYMLGQYLGYVS